MSCKIYDPISPPEQEHAGAEAVAQSASANGPRAERATRCEAPRAAPQRARHLADRARLAARGTRRAARSTQQCALNAMSAELLRAALCRRAVPLRFAAPAAHSTHRSSQQSDFTFNSNGATTPRPAGRGRDMAKATSVGSKCGRGAGRTARATHYLQAFRLSSGNERALRT